MKLVELRNAYRIPGWVPLKLLYTFAPNPALFRLPRAAGLVRALTSNGRAPARGRLERRLGERYTPAELHRIARRTSSETARR